MAGNASSIRAGRAYVELGTQDDFLKAGLDKAKRMLQTWGAAVTAAGSSLIGLGAGIVTPLVGAAMAFGQMGTELSHLSARTGIGIEDLSTLGFAAQQSGVSVEMLAHGLMHLARTTATAANGGQEATQALAMLHLRAADLVNLAPDQQLSKIADAISAIGNPTQKAAAALAVFGRSGTQMLPLLNQGAAGLAEFRRQAQAAGLAWSGEDAAAAVKLTQATNLLTASFHKAVAVLGGAIAPLLIDFVAWVTPIIKNTADWLKANSGLVRSLFQIGLGIAAAGAALVAVGAALQVASVGVGVLTTAWTALQLVIGAALAPEALLVGLAGYLLYTSGILKQLGPDFAELKDTAVTAWGGIVDAMKSGDVALAAQIAARGVELAWLQSTSRVRSAWAEMKFEFVDHISDMILSSGFLTKAFEEWGLAMDRLLNKVGLLSDEDMAKHADRAAAVMAMNDEQRKDLHRAVRRGAADDMAGERAGIAADIERLKGELANLREKARPAGFVGPLFKKTPALASPFQMMAHGDAAGTFSAAAAGRMGFGHTLAERTATATERTADAAEGLLNRPEAAFG